MKIAFFGTSAKSIPILNSLIQNFDLGLCITKKDVKYGRKLENKETMVKTWAKENNIPYFCADNIKIDQIEICELLKKNSIELGIVADFSYMLPKNIIETPKKGLINIHFSLLPLLRGASPVQHAILNGFEYTGITYYLMDLGMDTGAILDQIVMPLEGTETTGKLYNIMFQQAATELPKIINSYINENIQPQEQDHTMASYCYSKTNPKSTIINKQDALIDWKDSVEHIERQIRAYNPWPISWTYLENLEHNHKITEKIELKNTTNKKLSVKIHKATILENKLKIEKLQIEGKNILDWKSFKNGYVN